MDGLTTKLPEDLAELIALVQEQQAQLANSEKRNERLQKKLQSKDNTIEKLEERLRALLIHRFGKRSERIDPNQFTLFNEAELTVDADVTDEALSGASQQIDVKPHSRKQGGNRKALPEHLARVDVVHELDEHERQCGCGDTLNKIGEDVQEQL